jgi:hypothetical protein
MQPSENCIPFALRKVHTLETRGRLEEVKVTAECDQRSERQVGRNVGRSERPRLDV